MPRKFRSCHWSLVIGHLTFPMVPRSQLVLLAAIGASAVVEMFSGHIDPYYLLVIKNVGINVILAVSLNLINGYTGQFSLGHAGFMAVGAYVTASITMFAGPNLLPRLGGGESVAG